MQCNAVNRGGWDGMGGRGLSVIQERDMRITAGTRGASDGARYRLSTTGDAPMKRLARMPRGDFHKYIGHATTRNDGCWRSRRQAECRCGVGGVACVESRRPR